MWRCVSPTTLESRHRLSRTRHHPLHLSILIGSTLCPPSPITAAVVLCVTTISFVALIVHRGVSPGSYSSSPVANQRSCHGVTLKRFLKFTSLAASLSLVHPMAAPRTFPVCRLYDWASTSATGQLFRNRASEPRRDDIIWQLFIELITSQNRPRIDYKKPLRCRLGGAFPAVTLWSSFDRNPMAALDFVFSGISISFCMSHSWLTVTLNSEFSQSHEPRTTYSYPSKCRSLIPPDSGVLPDTLNRCANRLSDLESVIALHPVFVSTVARNI